MRISHVTTCHNRLGPRSSHEYVTRNSSCSEVFPIIVAEFVSYDLGYIMYTTCGKGREENK